MIPIEDVVYARTRQVTSTPLFRLTGEVLLRFLIDRDAGGSDIDADMIVVNRVSDECAAVG